MVEQSRKRRIAFIITSFIHYSRSLLILEELKNRSDVDLHVVLSGTALLSKYSSKFGHVKDMLEAEGYQNIHELYFNVEGDSHVVKARSTGLAIIEFSSLFQWLKPDVVVVRADRFEVLAAATAASYMNTTIAHIEGGDRTGTLDESVRHSITKLAHIHFPTTDEAKERILKMGEDPKYVFNFGSPDIEVARRLEVAGVDLNKTGSGAAVDIERDFIMVMYHPVWTEMDKAARQTRELLNSVNELGNQVLWFWPNFDAGAEETVAHEMRAFKDQCPDNHIRFLRYLPPEQFLWLLRKTKCLVGNSSAGIKESSYLGVPVVNIGSRQGSRLRSENVISVDHDKAAIQRAIKQQMTVGRFKPSTLYHADATAKNIAQTLAVVPLYIQKQFVE